LSWSKSKDRLSDLYLVLVTAPRNRELVMFINMLINMFMVVKNPFIYPNPKRFDVELGIDLFCQVF
jgi:hypothetical protein